MNQRRKDATADSEVIYARDILIGTARIAVEFERAIAAAELP
jgi:hypothetical protein